MNFPDDVNLWLDDVRPAPDGWIWVKTVNEAKELMAGQDRGGYVVANMSLDHDLGVCDDCFNNPEQWKENYLEQFTCTHNGTGYQFVCWMEEEDCWPANKPTVHSMNPVGKEKMQRVINKEYDKRTN